MPFAVYHLVKMVDTHVSPSRVVGHKYMHNIRQQREEQDEDHNDPLLDHTEGPEYVCLPLPPSNGPQQGNWNGAGGEGNNKT